MVCCSFSFHDSHDSKDYDNEPEREDCSKRELCLSSDLETPQTAEWQGHDQEIAEYIYRGRIIEAEVGSPNVSLRFTSTYSG